MRFKLSKWVSISTWIRVGLISSARRHQDYLEFFFDWVNIIIIIILIGIVIVLFKK